MKTFRGIFSLFLIIISINSASAQLVVPQGWTRDSIRFSPFAQFEFGPLNDTSSRGVAMNLSLDTIMANFAGTFGYIPYNLKPLAKRYAGISSGLIYSFDLPLAGITNVIQLQFLPKPIQNITNSPNGTPAGNVNSYSPYFRYNYSTGIWHANSFDSNEISPYMEFPGSRVLDTTTFVSYRYGNVPQSLSYGTEGRTVLGYSDTRLANQLFSTDVSYPYLPATDSAHNVSAILEFNVDTATSSIDTTGANGKPVDS